MILSLLCSGQRQRSVSVIAPSPSSRVSISMLRIIDGGVCQLSSSGRGSYENKKKQRLKESSKK
jgi:hypothetical protein